MARKTRIVSPKFFFVLIVFGAIWGAYRFYPREQAEIFAVSESIYGDIVTEGVIRADGQSTENNLYYLVTVDDQVYILDLLDIEDYVGKQVRVDGTLYPPVYENTSPFLVVNSMTEL